MKRSILFSMVIITLFLPVCSKATILYDIDFSSPAHTVGSQMTTGDGPAPRDTPSERRFGAQIVVDSFGSLSQQPVSLIPESSGFLRYSQFRLDLGFTERYPVYQLDFDVCMGDFTAGAYDNFVVLFDTPSVVRLDFNSYGNIMVKGYCITPGEIIGSFDFGQTLSMSVTVNLEDNTWSIYSNSNHLWTGQFFDPTPAHPEPTGEIDAIRFDLRDDSDFSNIPNCAVDNIQVIGVPEPTTILLLGLGGLLIRKRRRRFSRRRIVMRSKSVVLAAVLLLCFVSVGSAVVSFQGVGDLSGGRFYSIAEAVSADGSVVVGASESAGGNEAFRWTSSGGIQGLGELPGGGYSSWAKSVSGDGSVVTGFSDSGSDSYKQEAFIWTQSGGMQGIGFLPGATNSIAYGVSRDGSVITGRSNFQAYRYLTASSSFVSLGVSSSYVDISPDGSVVVGDIWSGHQAFRWSQSGGLVGLGHLSDEDSWSLAHSASFDGSIVVGESGESIYRMEAFLWTQAGGMIGLGDLPGGDYFSRAFAVSDDGSVVVGESSAGFNNAFIWDELNGMRNLKNVLEGDYGLDLSGWTLSTATGISADGLTIVGYGSNPYGYQEGWIATIPEPATVLLLGLGGLVLRRRCR